MTDPTARPTRPKKAHRAAGSRKVVAALSAAATAGLMLTMATAKPAWTVESEVQAAPDPVQPSVAPPSVAAPTARSQILLPVPPASDGSVVSPTVAPATPQPVQLDPVAAAPQVVTKTVVVKGGGGSATTKSNGSR